MLSRVVRLLALVAVASVSAYPGEPMYDTIIVGMGAAGCTAASVLCKAGKRVLALEAQNRVGGRIYTVPFGDGVVELGAEWINGEQFSPAYDLAMQQNISLLAQNSFFQLLRSDGTNENIDILRELFKYAGMVFAEPPKDPEPVGQFVTRRMMEYIASKHSKLLQDQEFLDEFFHFLNLRKCSFTACNDWNEITTHSKLQGLKGNHYLSWHKYGYQTLFDILLNTYEGGPGLSTLNLQLQKVVTKISYPQEPMQDVEVTCEDGSTYRARNVIVTISLGVLKESFTRLFSPALPQTKISAINGISMGVIGKITLLFPHTWWRVNTSDLYSFFWVPADKKASEQDWALEIAGATVPMGNRNAMTLWTNGNTTKLMETLIEDVVKSKAMSVLRRFLGKDREIPEPVDMLRTTWFSNPYTRGTYSFDNVQAPLHPNIRAELAEPLVDSSGAPRVLFAGEATNSIHYSTVHGAIESGHREAARLVENLNM